MEQKLVHAAAVAEADFGLGRMHVDVDLLRRQLDELRVENAALRAEVARLRNGTHAR